MITNLVSDELRNRLIDAQQRIQRGDFDEERIPILGKLSGPDGLPIYLLVALDSTPEAQEDVLWAVVDYGDGNVSYGSFEAADLQNDDLHFEQEFLSEGLFVDSVTSLDSLSDDTLNLSRSHHRGLRL